MADKQEKSPEKAPKTSAPVRADLPALPKGTTWDKVDIGDYEFKVAVPTGSAGILALSKGNEKIAAGVFTRAWRILIPQRLDARKRLDEAKTPEAKRQVAKELQDEILDFDVTTVRVSTPQAKRVTLPKDITPGEVVDSLVAQGYEVVLN
jgi:hypothetical protein